MAEDSYCPFQGKAYRYPTGPHGVQTIGVAAVANGLWAVCYVDKKRMFHRLKIRQLQPSAKAAAVQERLDQWAALCRLEAV